MEIIARQTLNVEAAEKITSLMVPVLTAANTLSSKVLIMLSSCLSLQNDAAPCQRNAVWTHTTRSQWFRI